MEDEDVVIIDHVSAPNKSGKRPKVEKSPAGGASAIIDADSPTPTPTEASTRSRRTPLKKVFPDEKREARYRSAPTPAIMDRIVRAVSQRMYLVSQEEKSTEGNLWRKYAVLGSTGNVYEVHVKKIPMCSCPDFDRGNLCKHVLFVMLKVLRVNQNSPLIYQKALLQSELDEMFERAPDPLAVRATKAVVDAYAKATGGASSSTVKEEEPKEEEKKEEEKPVDGDCPICFECMKGSKEAVDRCETCHNCVHRDCLQQWLRRSETCPYCRSDWLKAGSSKGKAGKQAGQSPSSQGGYLNFGSLQGQSTRRDTSTYRKRSRYGYDGYGYGGGGWEHGAVAEGDDDEEEEEEHD